MAIFMLDSYPMSDIHRRVLIPPKKPNHCLGWRELKNLKNYSNSIVFLWLTSRYGFWYHIKFVKGNILVGYMLVKEKWKYHSISIKKIYFYY